jgi:hypothetical protein
MPTDIMWVIFGFVLCFAGGLYPTLFAAIEAGRLCGWDRTEKALMDLFEQSSLVYEAEKKDDKVDENGDGEADVDKLDAKELVLRKTKLALTTMDPGVINEAFAGLYTSWLAVFATLKIQFAATIALALSIACSMKGLLKFFKVEQSAKMIVSEPYHKWVPVIIDWTLKAIGMSIAWYI